MSAVSSEGYMQESDLFRCGYCQDCFRREDHLRRHELSHGFPRFLCTHDGCGMRFHRRDVLQRHKSVHQHDPTKRRRRPRRGVLPRIQQAPDREVQGGVESQPQQTTSLSPSALLSASTERTVSLAATPEAFGLAEEWNLGLEDWPNYSWISEKYHAHSWQSFAVPMFDANVHTHPPATSHVGYQPVVTSTMPNLSIPAIAPAPGLSSVALAAPPVYPMTAGELQLCLVTFTKTYLPRLPFIHSTTCEQVSLYSPLGLSMACVGALRVDEYRNKAMALHEKAIEVDQLSRQTSEICLQDLQARVLLIELAAWHGSAETLQWAIREEHVLCQTIMEYLKRTLPHMSKNSWASWQQAEELKRTVFAFFVTSVWKTAYHHHATPLPTQFIDFTLPCPEPLWEATSASAWSSQMQCLSHKDRHEIHFPTAVHAILSRDTVQFTDYEMATIFGQQILLSAILDALNTAVSLPVNYRSVEGWQSGDMSTFQPHLRHMFEGALDLWVELWWAAPEWLWDSQLPSHPRVECILLHYYTTIKLFKPARLDQLRTEEDLVYKFVRAATEIFCSMSKAGWSDIAKYAARLLHATSYHSGIACARIMLPWLAFIQSPAYGPLNQRDLGLLTKIRQAVRRRDRELAQLSRKSHSSDESVPRMSTNNKNPYAEATMGMISGGAGIGRKTSQTSATSSSLGSVSEESGAGSGYGGRDLDVLTRRVGSGRKVWRLNDSLDEERRRERVGNYEWDGGNPAFKPPNGDSNDQPSSRLPHVDMLLTKLVSMRRDPEALWMVLTTAPASKSAENISPQSRVSTGDMRNYFALLRPGAMVNTIHKAVTE
ncbi:hypothetical protein K490DRAFT_54621 [Saccharata proteae CBS 121410]|uniref:C2H2-type domain-containing protein n=1 Tax=Saccharata proteae CBS 121410 TaxID=1314787 RepID=A0A9P4LYE4_9PEZI|nr:hypothetical protein K490DRAFT_54621 [Saccharata proteae CBS 121410]